MITKEQTLLEIVEDYPEREIAIREFDKEAGACLLCENLFDSIAEIEKKYEIDLSKLVERLNRS